MMRFFVILSLIGSAARADTLVYRFIDHAGEATLEHADLTSAWQKLEWPAKLPSPYSGLRGEDALRVIELALTDADVADFGRPHAAQRTVKLDPVWNRTRAVYESKTSLFSPAGARWTFQVPQATTLRGWVAPVPGSPPVDATIEIDGQKHALHLEGGWLAFDLPVTGAHTIAFSADGTVFWGDPTLVRAGEKPPGPNLLLVIIDTLRADAVPAMPRLRSMPGAHFQQAITAATWTRPSLLALLGGDLPTRLGQSAEEMIPPDSERRKFYAVSPPLLPRLLESHGWRADAIGNNFFLLGYPQIGLSLGFETVADVRHPILDTPAIERAAETYIASHKNEAWYLQVHFDGPHWPYTPPPEYLKRVQVPAQFPADSMARAYLGEALYADDYLGRLLDALKKEGLDQRTIVVVVGDHGEIFDHAHDQFVEALGQPTLHHHGWSAYDEILRVPLVIAGAGDRSISQQVSLVDVLPTVCELLGVAPGRSMLGRSLMPLVKGGTLPDRPTFTEGQNVRALRENGTLYLERRDGRLRVDGREVNRVVESYRDPQQHQDLGANAELRAEMARLAPTPPEAPVGVVHLRLARDEARAHEVDGILRSDGNITVRGLDHAQASPVDAHALKVSLRGPGEIDVAVDPPDATLHFELTRDGTAVRARDLLIGRFALPMLTDAQIDAARWSWLDAARPPVDGERGDLLLWRDPSHAVEVPAVTARANDEVAGMMRRWGYAQPGK